jgi:hypothetical protein
MSDARLGSIDIDSRSSRRVEVIQKYDAHRPRGLRSQHSLGIAGVSVHAVDDRHAASHGVHVDDGGELGARGLDAHTAGRQHRTLAAEGGDRKNTDVPPVYQQPSDCPADAFRLRLCVCAEPRCRLEIWRGRQPWP